MQRCTDAQMHRCRHLNIHFYLRPTLRYPFPFRQYPIADDSHMPFNLARQCQKEKHAARTRNPHTQLCSILRTLLTKRWCGVQLCGEGECVGPRTSQTPHLYASRFGRMWDWVSPRHTPTGCHSLWRPGSKLVRDGIQPSSCRSPAMQIGKGLPDVFLSRFGRRLILFPLFSLFLPFPLRACFGCFGEGPCAGLGRWRGGAELGRFCG